VIQGSCLCGAVAFEIAGRVTPIQLCHARRCQKSTGSAFSAEVAARADRFRWLRGAENIQHSSTLTASHPASSLLARSAIRR